MNSESHFTLIGDDSVKNEWVSSRNAKKINVKKTRAARLI